LRGETGRRCLGTPPPSSSDDVRGKRRVPRVAARITATYSGSRERRRRPPPGGVGGEDRDGIVFYSAFFLGNLLQYLWLRR
jgi:hypothetical protein